MATACPTSALSPAVETRYRIEALLGRGGMGTVYKATHLGLRLPVALKVLDPEADGDNDDDELDARFEREARTAALLRHPGCVRVLDYGKTADQRRYIAMEYLEGSSLAEEMAARGRYSVAEAVQVASQILRALAHAHGRGVLHRDIKPENIMNTPEDGGSRWVLIDFGLAQLVDDAPITAAGMCFGSPSYVAPERLLGRLYDERADLYAVGVVLYEMLAGARPFHGASPEETALAHIKAPVPRLELVRPDVPPSLLSIIYRALEKRPEHRYPDAEAMLSALAQVPMSEAPFDQAAGERIDEGSTIMVLQLGSDKPPLYKRLWARLRYGAWRWSQAL